MLDSLRATFHRLIAAQSCEVYRYLYPDFSLNERLIGLIGPRGVGKTTMLLQKIKDTYPTLERVFYFSADHIYFNSHHLYQFVEKLILEEDIEIFFIDEVHKYPNWDQEIKNLYDSFPNIKIVFSGSSSLDLVKGAYDLSRRAKLYHLQGLSFREYLHFESLHEIAKIEFDELIKDPRSFNNQLSIPSIRKHFQSYLKNGYYPFYTADVKITYEKTLRMIDKTIYEDVANFYKLKTHNLSIFKRILSFLATIEPGNVNTHNLAKNLSIDDKTADSYLLILHETGLIRPIFPYAKGNQILRKPEKIFLNNTTLSYALSDALGDNLSIGTVRELFFIQSLANADIPIFYSKIGDYRTQQVVFEIGGKNKKRTQLQATDQTAYLVKDDIGYATPSEIPLHFFGFLY